MKTAYLIKSPSKNISFDSDTDRGIILINSVIDLTFLNNSVFNGNLKISGVLMTGEMGQARLTAQTVASRRPFCRRTPNRRVPSNPDC